MHRILFICHGNICRKAEKARNFNGFWTLHNRF